MRIRPVTPADADPWSRMRHDLWPGDSAASHAVEVRAFLQGDRRIAGHVLVAEDPDTGRLCGFAELSERSHASECVSSPVAFVEGLYVVPDARRRGVARALLHEAEAWARARRLTEIASDCLSHNEASIACHRAAGFEVTEHAINFRKTLGGSGPPPARLDMIGLFVADLPRMVAFYRDVVGMAIDDWQPPYAEFVHHGVRFSMFERARVPELLGRSADFPGAKPGRLNGSFELALRVHDADEVDAVFGRMTGRGAEPVTTPRDEPWGMRSAYVADPEGNLIEIAGPPKGAA